MGEIDNNTQQYLKEVYGRPRPSPEFRQRLFQELTRELQARQQPVGWLQRVTAQLVGPAASGWRPAISVIVALAILVLVMGTAVLAVRRPLDRIFQRERGSQEQTPTVVGTPTTEPLASPVSAVEPLADRPSPTLAATPAEPGRPAIIPTLTAASPSAPTATSSPTSTSTSVPTAIASPTATSTVPSVQVTNTPTPTQTEVTSAPSPTPASCAGRVAGVAWVDANGNGGRDQGDPPLGGVTVTLKDAAGQHVGTMTTGGGGYAFDNLSTGFYTLHATTPAGYRASTPQDWGIVITCATIPIDFGYQPEQ